MQLDLPAMRATNCCLADMEAGQRNFTHALGLPEKAGHSKLIQRININSHNLPRHENPATKSR